MKVKKSKSESKKSKSLNNKVIAGSVFKEKKLKKKKAKERRKFDFDAKFQEDINNSDDGSYNDRKLTDNFAEEEVEGEQHPDVVDLCEEEEEEFQTPRLPFPPTPIKKGRGNVGRNEPKIPKIRRSATNENVEENYMIVPWKSSDEWNSVCLELHCGDYETVIRKIAVWQRRVPVLPVGVEATLFLLEALLYDHKLLRNFSNLDISIYTEDQARALYSLAIIRYLNHVNHLAAQSIGETTIRPAQELAAIMDTPDWLVSLRNDVSHGPRAPSIEILRMGGNFVLQWLKEKYWKRPEEETTSNNNNDPFTIIGENAEVDISRETSRRLTAYVAARIYKKRNQYTINDPNIVSLVPSSADSLTVKTKLAVISLRNSLRGYLISHPSIFCDAVSEELIPTVEFYEDFTSIFQKKYKEGSDDDGLQRAMFEQWFSVWLPIIKMLETKGKLVTILDNISDIMIDSDNEKVKMVTASWIDKILEMIEISGKKYSKQLVSILRTLMKHPNSYMDLFLARLCRLAEPRVGSEAVQKLKFLMAIWSEGGNETRKRKHSFSISTQKLFSLSNIEGSNDADKMDDETLDFNRSNLAGQNEGGWMLDTRGEEFWRNIPLGGIV